MTFITFQEKNQKAKIRQCDSSEIMTKPIAAHKFMLCLKDSKTNLRNILAEAYICSSECNGGCWILLK